ncbi:VOC family protein [Luteipulveratus mongoliensis]|uniref:Glyoxalase-like domain-containing protein n=1 Tax=Luteipulveratus mongoliensis TaxID=571913 RepID=A0A0K1JM50_9MICO|nr:VOC family protein [Luteipulveratus mongoliensis]AKU17787.1 hypothetical protein VV02_21240 [Luteipulveratus mongoliensis]
MIRWITAFLDTPAPRAVAAEEFWQVVTASSLSPRRGGGAFVTFVPDHGDPCLRAQVIENGTAGVHLDLHVDDLDAASPTAVDLGAEVVHTEPGLHVLRSPGRMPFCLVTWEGEHDVRPPVTVGGAVTSLDQVCLDIPESQYDVEVAFWSGLTGWEVRQGLLPEFAWMPAGNVLPIRLLLQRTRDADGDVRGHIDLAAGPTMREVATATRAHLALGATAGEAFEHWQVMADPVGRTYCLTARDPHAGRLRSSA